MLTDHIIDPELYVILQALKSARRFLHHVSDQVQNQFLDLVAAPPKETLQISAPAEALSHFVNKLQWQIDRRGQIYVDGFLKLDLKFGDWKTIEQCALRSWAQQVSASLSRKDWKQAPELDPVATRKLFKKYAPGDQYILTREICGGFLYQSQKAKFDEETTPACLFYGQPDNAIHRLRQYEATQHIREQHDWCLRQLEERHDVALTLPVAYEEPITEFYRYFFHKKTEVAWVLRPPSPHRRRYYTDGSYQFPTMKNCRWATYSVICEDETLIPTEAAQLLAGRNAHLQVIAIGFCPGR